MNGQDNACQATHVRFRSSCGLTQRDFHIHSIALSLGGFRLRRKAVVPRKHQGVQAEVLCRGQSGVCPMYEHVAPGGSGYQDENPYENRVANAHGIVPRPRGVYKPLPSRICGPPVIVSTCASCEIQIAETSVILLINALPFVGPSSSRVVDKASDTVAVLEM